MDKTASKHRKKLNAGQLEVLSLLYKFRFGSNDLFAQYFGKKDRSFVHKRLAILLDQGLIGKRFDSSYRLHGRPAAYYLTPAGARALQGAKGTELNIKTIYKDKSVSEDFISYSMRIFAIYCQLRAMYGEGPQFFTKIQLSRYDYFSDFTPSVYLRINADGRERNFFLEYLPNSKPLFTHIRRVKQYSDYFDSGEWEDGTGADFPTVLLICETSSQEKYLLKNATRALEDAGDGLEFYVIKEEAFMSGGGATWTSLSDTDLTSSLQNLP